MAAFKDHFSDLAAGYAAHRPTYPKGLVDYLAGLAPARRLAWDCGCGSGQLSTLLADAFERVTATDASAAVRCAQPHTQVGVIGQDESARRLYRAALAPFSFSKTVLQLSDSELAPQNLPPALAQTLSALPQTQTATALICSGFTCQPPVTDPEELARLLHNSISLSFFCQPGTRLRHRID